MIIGTVVGNLGRDPELKHIGSSVVLDLNIASDARRKVGGEWQDVTYWIRASLWGARAESLARILGKGSHVVAFGELSLREFTRKDGTTGTSLELKAYDIELGPKRTTERSAGQHHESRVDDFPPAPDGEPDPFPTDDDIPF